MKSLIHYEINKNKITKLFIFIILIISSFIIYPFNIVYNNSLLNFISLKLNSDLGLSLYVSTHFGILLFLILDIISIRQDSLNEANMYLRTKPLKMSTFVYSKLIYIIIESFIMTSVILLLSLLFNRFNNSILILKLSISIFMTRIFSFLLANMFCPINTKSKLVFITAIPLLIIWIGLDILLELYSIPILGYINPITYALLISNGTGIFNILFFSIIIIVGFTELIVGKYSNLKARD